MPGHAQWKATKLASWPTVLALQPVVQIVADNFFQEALNPCELLGIRGIGAREWWMEAAASRSRPMIRCRGVPKPAVTGAGAGVDAMLHR